MAEEIFRPDTAAQVADLIAWAAAEGRPLAVRGRGSKAGLGRPVNATAVLDLSGLNGITLYEPEELVLAAGAGTPLAAVEAALADQGQALAFEPPDLGPLLGGEAGQDSLRQDSLGQDSLGQDSLGQASLGGTIACNLAGPRRIAAGALRDHLLGFHGVTGRGESFKSGGRVVKNVTGYDLSKLVAGSYGTLAVLTDATVKVLPAPEATRTVVLPDLDAAAAVRAMTRALHSVHAVSGAAHLPPGLGDGGGAMTVLRIEGAPAAAVYRAEALAAELADVALPTIHEDAASLTLWRRIRDVAPFVGLQGEAVWRLSVPPADGAAVVARLGAALPAARWFLDWGGGLIWLSVPQGRDAQQESVRAALTPCGGHALLIKAEGPVRAAVAVFQPQEPGLAAVSARVKDAFDPRGILNPGRMVAA